MKFNEVLFSLRDFAQGFRSNLLFTRCLKSLWASSSSSRSRSADLCHLEPRFSASSRRRRRNPAGRMLIGCVAEVPERRNTTLQRKGRQTLGARPPSGWSPQTEWMTSRAETRACGFYDTFFCESDVDYTHALSEQTTVTWPGKIAWVMQNLLPIIVAVGKCAESREEF